MILLQSPQSKGVESESIRERGAQRPGDFNLHFQSVMRFFSEKNIKIIIFFSSIILVALLSLGFALFYVAEKYTQLEKDLPGIEDAYVSRQQELLKSLVELQVQQIDFRRRQMEQLLQKTLQIHVQETVAIANNLYNMNKNLYSFEAITTMVREALRPVRFNQGRGYFFAISIKDKVLQLYPPKRTYEGQPVDSIFASSRLAPLKDMMAQALVQKKGCIQYDWPMPGDDSSTLHKKISCYHYIEQLDWLVGVGEYLEHFSETVKKTVLDEINLYMGVNPQNYFFVYDLHRIEGGKNFATMLVNPNRPDLIGTKLSDDYTDTHGHAFRKDFLKGLQRDGEAFVTYWYPKPGDTTATKKMSFFLLYPQWNWVVAKGMYLDELDRLIAEEKRELEQEVSDNILFFSLYFLGAVGVIVALAHFFTRRITIILERHKKIQTAQQQKLKEVNRVLHKQAITDNLTGLFNRQHFNTHINRHLSGASRYGDPLSLVLFDIDNFKEINDTFGHLCGDTVLNELARLVGAHVRESDILARWGGEEFVLLVVGIDHQQALSTSHKLCDLIADHAFSIKRQLTCSFGVTQFISGETADDFIHRADRALYAAKEAGKNTACVR